jgi:hypothetical protein
MNEPGALTDMKEKLMYKVKPPSYKNSVKDTEPQLRFSLPSQNKDVLRGSSHRLLTEQLNTESSATARGSTSGFALKKQIDKSTARIS